MDIQKEPFIPLSRFALIEQLTDLADNKFGDDYPHFLQHLAAWRHQYYRIKLQRFKELYLPFSPDRDTLKVLEYTPSELRSMQDELISELSTLLIQANYSRLTVQDIETIFAAKSAYGLELKVDLSEFEQVLLFSRGSAIEQHQRRTLKSLFLKKESYEVPIFQRLFLLLKLKPEATRIKEIMAEHSVEEAKAEKLLKKYRDMLPDKISDDFIYLKTFKQIPQIDLEMLFPNTQVKLKVFDKIKLGVTAGGGTVGSVVGAVTKLAAAANPLAAGGILLGLIGVIFRQVKKFFTQKNKYMMVLAQKLYFHNLANNRGVLTLMTDRAEEEEIKESFLLYHFLASETDPQLPETIKANIEQYIENEFGARIDFDIKNPIQALSEDSLLLQHADNRISAINPADALTIVERLWKAAISTNNSPSAPA
ncbi:MAG TPA: DUF3754 domain-containing protein [Gammaproteobacteria bacterium]|nr:DUF3754 domain-containing protein [Gammaproteobacteria bacterium]